MSNFTFGHNVFKSCLLLLLQNASAGGKGLSCFWLCTSKNRLCSGRRYITIPGISRVRWFLLLNPFPHTTNLKQMTLKTSRQKYKNSLKVNIYLLKTSWKYWNKLLIMSNFVFFQNVLKNYLLQMHQNACSIRKVLMLNWSFGSQGEQLPFICSKCLPPLMSPIFSLGVF